MADSLMEDDKFFDDITTNLASNTLFVNEVASKLSSLSLENEEIKQAMFDSFSLQFQQEIDSLKSKCANLQAKNYELKLEVERGEQYSRRNCLLFHGINYESNKSRDFKIKRFLLEHLQIEIKLDDIDRSHIRKKGAHNSQIREI